MRKLIFPVLAVLLLLSPLQAGELRVSGNIVDVVNSRIYPGTVVVKDGRIAGIEEEQKDYKNYLIPGLVDAHVHIESSMLVPSEFARLAVTHGTVATVSDPHEIANVLGVPGIKFMIENGKKIPFKFNFGAPSCVPATGFETAGAKIGTAEIEELFNSGDIKYLSEMMNYPGVLHKDPEVRAKLLLAKKYKKPIDGHAPGLAGEDLIKYARAGISTDHETYMLKEGREKIRLGMKVIIRSGSAANNFMELNPLLGENPGLCMFGSDDKHPDDLALGEIDLVIKRAFELGYDKMDVLKCATLNPVRHYGLDAGLLQKGDAADLIVVDNLEDFNVLQTYVNGQLVAENGKSLIRPVSVDADRMNLFNVSEKRPSDFKIRAGGGKMKVIEAVEGQLITKKIKAPVKNVDGYAEADPENDILKIAVINRYADKPVAVGFVKNFRLRSGAIAQSIAHDSHNIVVIGASDEDMARAANIVIKNKGGLALVYGNKTMELALPVAGLMTTEDGYYVAKKYSAMTEKTREMGSSLRAPFMTGSFMALLVIPELKLSDKGLFDGKDFRFTEVFEE